MQNSERGQFEESWKSAFDGAEMTPSDRLWSSIELEMTGTENASMKRRVVFYQRLAAATVLFALLSGAYAIYTYRGNTQDIAGVQKENPQKVDQGKQSPSSQSNTPLATDDQTRKSDTPNTNGDQNKVPPDRQTLREVVNAPIATLPIDRDGDSPPATFDSSPLSDPVVIEEQQIAIARDQNFNIPIDSDSSKVEEPQLVKLLSADEINALAEAKAKEEEKKAKSDRSLWLGLGGAAGSYAPNATVAGGSLMQADQAPSSYSSSQNIPQSHSANVGSAYSAGVSGGLQIAKRWVVQSGLNYINQKLDYTTNFVGITNSNQATAMTKDYIAATPLSVAVTNPYEISSSTEILSIPVQAGFLIIDRKFGWQLNTGVSTDFLIRNTLTDKSGLRSKVSEGAGENSPYRSVNGAALLNTELSYKIGDHYRLALVPGMRYSFKPMLKEDVTGTPFVLDIGFRFKYLFN